MSNLEYLSRREFLKLVGKTAFIRGAVLLPSNLAYAESSKPKIRDKIEVEIPNGKINDTKIYVSKSGLITNPRGVTLEKIFQSTPEYKEMEDTKYGSGRYSQLLSNASNRTIKLIQNYAQKNKIEFVAEIEPLIKYLKSQEKFKDMTYEDFKSFLDITPYVINSINEKKIKEDKENKKSKTLLNF